MIYIILSFPPLRCYWNQTTVRHFCTSHILRSKPKKFYLFHRRQHHPLVCSSKQNNRYSGKGCIVLLIWFHFVYKKLNICSLWLGDLTTWFKSNFFHLLSVWTSDRLSCRRQNSLNQECSIRMPYTLVTWMSTWKLDRRMTSGSNHVECKYQHCFQILVWKSLDLWCNWMLSVVAVEEVVFVWIGYAFIETETSTREYDFPTW